jgi:radical SAM superfamily enzyme with C-terminal helix-hairpin-helix motif
MKKITILDCYTDEPAGLGVPPFLGTYPRYIAGSFDSIPTYLTIDDLRLLKKYNSEIPLTPENKKTDISVYNLTKNYKKVKEILKQTDELIVIIGVHTPGKYLSAIPGTINELKRLLIDIKCKKILTGPAIYGTQMQGGRFQEKDYDTLFDEVRPYNFSYEEIKKLSVKGASLVNQLTDKRIIEIETGRGCERNPGCSFCLEPLKSKKITRSYKDILTEIKEFHELGIRDFRLGKQSCIYSYPDIITLLKEIRNIGNLNTLHIDNANPRKVVDDKNYEITKAIVKYCTAGNIAAFGIESFDPIVIEKNNLNSDIETTFKAIEIINKYGSKRAENGMPTYLPGINIILGLIGESKKTLKLNYEELKKIMAMGFLFRRINIRQVVPFKNTFLEETAGNKFLRKNNRHYYSFRRLIREEIDHIMLQKLVPKGTIIRDVIPEIYDGKTTFCRQIGTYPLIIGVKERIPLKVPVNIKVIDYMLRSIIGEQV